MLYLSRGHKMNDPNSDTGAVYKNIREVDEIFEITKIISRELTLMGVGYTLLEDMSLKDTIRYLNTRMTKADIAIEIHKDSFDVKDSKRVGMYIDIEGKSSRQLSDEFLKVFLSSGASKDSWIRPHTLRNLAFVKDIRFPSLIVEFGHLQDETCISDREYYGVNFCKIFQKIKI